MSGATAGYPGGYPRGPNPGPGIGPGLSGHPEDTPARDPRYETPGSSAGRTTWEAPRYPTGADPRRR